MIDDLLFLIYLQTVPIRWTSEHGLDTVVTGNGVYTLNFLAKLHGVSIDFLLSKYPDIPRSKPIPVGTIIRFNKPQRWLTIAKWFSDWEKWVRDLPNLTRTEKNKLFITHQLHNDLQRTCHSMYNMIQEYVVGNSYRRWIPRRFSQDVVESLFGVIRQSGGGNTDSCRRQVDKTLQRERSKHVHKTIHQF